LKEKFRFFSWKIRKREEEMKKTAETGEFFYNKKGVLIKMMPYNGKMPVNKWHELKKLVPVCYDNTRGCRGKGKIKKQPKLLRICIKSGFADKII